jgi:hypothetical protein
MRRYLALSALAVSAFGFVATANAAEPVCVGQSGGQTLGACYHNYCPDKCTIYVYTECEGYNPKICALLTVGSKPGS